MQELNLRDLYAKVFSYKGLPSFPLSTTARVNKGEGEGNDIQSSLIKYKLNRLGNPYFMPATLDGFDLPNEPMIHISGSKTIIKTDIDGNDGEFLELFALNSYKVVIKGLAINPDAPDDYPEEIVRQLRETVEKKKSVAITCDITTYFGISLVAIESFDFPPMEGFPGIQPYEFTCISDKEFDIELKKIAEPRLR